MDVTNEYFFFKKKRKAEGVIQKNAMNEFAQHLLGIDNNGANWDSVLQVKASPLPWPFLIRKLLL